MGVDSLGWLKDLSTQKFYIPMKHKNGGAKDCGNGDKGEINVTSEESRSLDEDRD